MMEDTKSRSANPERYVAILRNTSSNEGDCSKKTCRGITTIPPIRPNSRATGKSSERDKNSCLNVNEDKYRSMEPNINFNVAGSPISRNPRSPPENLPSRSYVDDSDTNLSSPELIIEPTVEKSDSDLSESISDDHLLVPNVVITVNDGETKSSGDDQEISDKGNESDTNDEFSAQENGSTQQLLDPDVPADCLSSSRSTPETQVVDERAAGEASEHQRQQKFVEVKRSSSATCQPAATDVLASSAPSHNANNNNNLRRMLGERPGFTELGLGMCGLGKTHTFRRGCHLFDDDQKVTATRSLDGDWLLSDHPNPFVPPLVLHAQESAFPLFYDKIERPVPLPPWDDPNFALEERPATTASVLPPTKRRLKSMRFSVTKSNGKRI